MNEMIYQLQLPEMLKVKDGFHHDLNAIVNVELRGPNLPWEDEMWITIKLDAVHIYKHKIESITFSKKFLLACHDAAT